MNEYNKVKILPDVAKDMLPKFLKKIALAFPGKAVNLLLDLTYYATRRYTDKRFKSELKGIAMGSRVSYITLRRINMMPELI
jgi:hypothetical protein